MKSFICFILVFCTFCLFVSMAQEVKISDKILPISEKNIFGIPIILIGVVRLFRAKTENIICFIPAGNVAIHLMLG